MTRTDGSFDLRWDSHLRQAWERWLEPYENKVHHTYGLAADSLDGHVRSCFQTAEASMSRVLANMETPASARRVLDHGASAGFNAFALQALLPGTEIVGIDPDAPAVALAQAMRTRIQSSHERRPYFLQGVGEDLPFSSGAFDVVVSLTVLEHVGDVERCLAEIFRVLRPGGLAYIETPNYVWPLEPHLGIIMPPRCPKPVLRVLARSQGVRNVEYLDHLNLVHPSRVERGMSAAGFQWRNLVAEKLDAVLSGRRDGVIAYGRASAALSAVGRTRLRAITRRLVLSTGLHPSLMYLARRPG